MRSPEYQAWVDARQRCNNPSNASWKDYGGRGVVVCSRWDSFDNFIADMGRRPPGTSLDRRDNDKGYSPDNCRWATATEQAYNRRTHSNNKTGIRGVSFVARASRYIAVISYGRRRICLGETPDFFEACCRRKSAENQFTTPVGAADFV